MAAARAGTVAYYIPSSVVKGMLAGIGLTLILKQVPHAVGYDADAEGEAVVREDRERHARHEFVPDLSQRVHDVLDLRVHRRLAVAGQRQAVDVVALR